MPHALYSDDTMASTGNRTPWHGLGAIVADDTLTGDQMLTAAGLRWEVGLAQLTAQIGDRQVPVSEAKATVRIDTGKVLGVVSDSYRVIQNWEMVRFLDALVDAGDGRFETAGSLFGNRVVWVLMRMPEHIIVGGVDGERLDQYMLVTTGHDGKHTFRVLPTSVRVVCNNTLSAALAGSRFVFTVPHIGNPQESIAAARKALDVEFRFAETIQETANRLVEQVVTADEAEGFLKALVPVGEHRTREAQEAAERAATNKRDALRAVYENTVDLAAIRGTRYGLLQATSAFESHHQRYINLRGVSSSEYRFATVLGLKGENLTSRAASILTGPLLN